MRQIKKVAVLGAGVMGATIAGHLANAGVSALLLDIVPFELSEDEKKKGLTMDDMAVRNRLANAGREGLKKMKPAALFKSEYAGLIETGNLTDDAEKLQECDWIVEVVVENMDIKKKLFQETVIPNMKKDAVLSTNTSGLSVNAMAAVLPEDVQKNFLVTHFFNPPRYMRLMEIVPCEKTDSEVVDFMADFLSQRLGKGIVYAKDTPNFIGNRIGVYSMYNAFNHMMDMGMTVEEVDAVAGPATARPRSAAFGTADLVGIDTLVHVGNNSYDLLPDDEERDTFKVPDFIKEMVKNGLLGNKTKKGFFKKEKTAEGRKKFYFDYNTGEYKPAEKPKFASVAAVKMIDDPAKKLQTVIFAGDKASDFAWKNLRDTCIYTFRRIPEIADDIVNIDNAMKWGYNWELGPFEMLDAIGMKAFVKRCAKDGVDLPQGMEKIEAFYKYEDNKKMYYDVVKGEYAEYPLSDKSINLAVLKKTGGLVEGNSNASIVDLGDGVFGLEFHSKMNAVTGDIMNYVHKAIKRAEEDGVGLVIGNQGANFSVGANLMMLAVAIAEGAYEDVDMAVRMFQKATMAVKYSSIPVVAAPFNMTLGGGCEFSIHADSIVASAETYMGLVEIGVGLLPGGGGTKEMCIRAVEAAEQAGTDVTPFIFKNFQNIGMAKVSFSADMAYDLGFMRTGDTVTMNVDNLIMDAKKRVLSLASNYRPKSPLMNVKAPGRSVAASIKSQLWNMKMGGFITEYEEFLGSNIADVICGGDVPAGTVVTEQYLLDLEREGFVKLCMQKKTVERIQNMLKTGKPLRN